LRIPEVAEKEIELKIIANIRGIIVTNDSIFILIIYFRFSTELAVHINLNIQSKCNTL